MNHGKGCRGVHGGEKKLGPWEDPFVVVTMLSRLIQLHLWRSSPHDGDKLGVYKSTCEHNKGDGRICDSYEDNEKRNLNDGPLSRFCGSSVIVPSLER